MSRAISIIICTRNRAESLRQTLASFLRLDVPTHYAVELLVVDNGSADATQQVVRDFRWAQGPVRYFVENRPGLAVCRNRGMRESDGDIILFTDDDVRVPSEWIEGMCRPIVDRIFDAVAGGVMLAPHLHRPWMGPYVRGALASSDSVNPDQPLRLIGANMAFSREVLTDVPAFDEELGAGAMGFAEETLFSDQLTQAGYRIGGALNVAVEHHFDPSRLSRRSLLASAKKCGQSEAYLAWHWAHESTEPCDRSWRSWKRDADVFAKVLRHRRQQRRAGGAPITDWEMFHVKLLAYRRQYRREMARPRNYEQRGLQKLHLGINQIQAFGRLSRAVGVANV